jgi:RNA polymerase sigma-70 factor (ECF subfamily)
VARPPTDDDIIRAFASGDAGALAELIRRHERRVYCLCLRVLGNADDAADAAQDALLMVVRKLDRYRGEAAFTTWLHRVTLNVCYDHLRRERRQPILRPAGDDELPEMEPGPPVPDHADAVATTRDVEEALRMVPEDFRVALVLADVQDLPYEEIARVLDVPVGTVKSRVHRGRVALARALGIAVGEPSPTSATSEEHA